MSTDESEYLATFHDRGLTSCSHCGTSQSFDPAGIGKAIAGAVREELAKHAPAAAESRSPLAEGDRSWEGGCEAQDGSEGLDLKAIVERFRNGSDYTYWQMRTDAVELIAEVRRLQAEITRRRRSIVAANARTERVEAALVRIRDERDEARDALAVAIACADSEAAAREEAEADLAALPEKIAAALERRFAKAGTHASADGRIKTTPVFGKLAAEVARSFIPAEPVPEPEREWGVRHAGQTHDWATAWPSRDAAHDSLANTAGRGFCNSKCHVVSRVPGGEWESAE